MPHDHPQDHSHDHGEYHTHDHNHHSTAEHMHSHMHDVDEAAELQVLTDQFIDGFCTAKDKMSYLRLAGVPLEKVSEGGPSLKLVDVQLTTEWQVGTASPSFGSRELSYMPYPGQMVTERTNMGLVYVSLEAKQITDIREFILHNQASTKENT